MGRDYNSDKYYEDNFDYESAREDLFDAGLDPDYLSTRNRERRDKYMKKNGFDPKKYGSRYTEQHETSNSNNSGWFFSFDVSDTDADSSSGSYAGASNNLKDFIPGSQKFWAYLALIAWGLVLLLWLILFGMNLRESHTCYSCDKIALKTYKYEIGSTNLYYCYDCAVEIGLID